jgi:hypothetical protein
MLMVNSEELIGTMECLTLQTRCRIKRCRYNRIGLYIMFISLISCAAEVILREHKDAQIATIASPLLFHSVHHMLIIVVNVADAYSVAPVTYARPVTCLISQMCVVC